MSENTTPSAEPNLAPAQTPGPKTKFDIGEEFGTAKKNLPPVKVLLIGLAIILLGWGMAAVLQRPHTDAIGAIDQVVSVEVPNQNMVMVAINVSFQNKGTKPFWIHTITTDVETANGNYSAEPASPVDFERYYQAFPTLKEYALSPLQRDSKVAPGGQSAGTIIVSYPIAPDAFANRKSLKVTIQPYDQPVPLVLTK
jgi:hypothetical protein